METMASEMLVYIVPAVIIGTILTLVFFMYANANRRLREEEGLQPLYEKKHPAYIGSFYYKVATVRVSVYSDFIVIGYFRLILLRFSEIRSVRPATRLLSKGYYIDHNNPNCPESIFIFAEVPSPLQKFVK